MKRFPAPETLDFLESLGVKRVIVHGHQIAPIPGRLQVEHRVGRATVMRLVRTVSKSRQQAEAEWYRSPKVYQACDMRGLVGRIDGTARAARRGERGVLIYGPYVMLPAGRYEASFSIEGEYDRYRFGDLFGRVEISTYPMGILVAERPLLRSTLASGDLVVPFTLDERTQMRKLELRVLTTGVAALRVTRIRVRPVPAHR